MKNYAPIGVMDSGVGGLSVLRCLRQLLPQEDFIYLGDTARAPYGSRTEAELRCFTEEILSYLESRGVKQVVLSCNTTTSLGIETLQKDHPFEIIGVSRGAQQLLQVSSSKRIGVFATPFTIGTQAHKHTIEAYSRENNGAEAQVFGIACPKFVPLIESEAFGSAEMQQAIAEYCSDLRTHNADTVLLGCTHYPFIQQELEAELGTAIKVVDPAMATAQDSLQRLQQQGLLATGRAEGGSAEICCTADLERVKRLAKRMLEPAGCSYKEIILR